ncbi:B12-binding domain-containing radical SAM protein [Pontiella desulfatans]|nr:B12-binding domain-containing radical SAM protein [Pontiella desulfatans]
MFPDTFWSFKHALSFVGKQATFPPLGLLTVAGLLPAQWDRRLVDLNVRKLRESDLAWADYAFITGMVVQKTSAREMVARCHEAGLKVVAGGPLFTMEHEEFDDVDHFILNEAEITLPHFLKDLAEGRPRRVYSTTDFAELGDTPLPAWELVDMKRYQAMEIQYSRGCPFNCDFCNITSLLGRRVRTKSTEQVIAELDALYAGGWRRGKVFFVDDNFIGNKRHLKSELLPRLIAWRNDRPGITFQTEASINLADDQELMDLMVAAGFDIVFIGIETPDNAALAECNKTQNEHRDLVQDVNKIQRAGLQVQGGFIVGFDSDKPSVFHRQIEFIQKSGIVTAMVGLLQAPQGTQLYQRMEKAGRLRGSSSGDNVEGTTNIVPLMDFDRLLKGYKTILNHIYAPRHYYERIRTMLSEYRPPKGGYLPTRSDLMALLRSFYRLGILGKERVQYWKLLLWTSFHRPTLFPLAVTLAISGYHCRKVCELHVH